MNGERLTLSTRGTFEEFLHHATPLGETHRGVCSVKSEETAGLRLVFREETGNVCSPNQRDPVVQDD